MPYASAKQRGFIHARAAEGAAWARKFVADADRMPQPTKEYAHKKPMGALKKAYRRRHGE